MYSEQKLQQKVDAGFASAGVSLVRLAKPFLASAIHALAQAEDRKNGRNASSRIGCLSAALTDLGVVADYAQRGREMIQTAMDSVKSDRDFNGIPLPNADAGDGFCYQVVKHGQDVEAVSPRYKSFAEVRGFAMGFATAYKARKQGHISIALYRENKDGTVEFVREQFEWLG